MAETVVINIEANTQGLQSTIDLLTKLGQVEKSTAEEFKKVNDQNTASIKNAAAATAKEFEKVQAAIKNVKGDNSLAKSLDVSKEVVAFGNGMKSIKQQLKEAVTEAQQLTEQFGELDPRTLAAAKRAAELRDAIGDVNAQIAALTPEGKFQAIQKLGGAISGVFQVATGSLQAFGVESETATKLAQQFQGALNIFGGLSQLTELKDAYTAVKAALGVTTAAKVADTAATEAQSVANVQATGTQLALNTAILANPYVLAAVALTAVVAALVAFSDGADEAKKKQQELNNELEGANAYYDGYVKALDRQTKLRLSDLDTQIKVRQAEGAGIQELADLQKERLRVEFEGVARLIKANEDKNASDKQRVRELRALGDEESVGKAATLEKEITDRVEANKDLVIQQRILKNDKLALEAETTAALKEEGDKQVKDAKNAADKIKQLTLGQALEDIRSRYAQERIEAGKLYTDKEAYAIADTEITQRELKEQLALYKQNSKEYQDILLKLQAITRSIDLTPVVKTPKLEKTADEGLLTPEEQAALQAGLDAANKAREEYAQKVINTNEKIAASTKALQNELLNFAVVVVGDQLTKSFEEQMSAIDEMKQYQLEAIAEEEEALLTSYENRRIGKRELEEQQKKLAEQRIAAEKKAEKELNEIRRKQDISKRAMALFEIALNTYRAVTAILADPTVLTTAKPGLIASAIALGGVQAAGVLAQPLPKYKKGTLSVPGTGTDDSQLALLQPGEAVIPTDTNRRYKTAISAIYNNKINPEELNRWVTMRLKGSVSEGSDRSVTAHLSTTDLYSLSRMMKKNDGVYVKNIGELAAVFESLSNPRR